MSLINFHVLGQQSRIEIDCPGTSEHMRSVTIQMNTGVSIVETTSPIAFSLANQKHIFRATSEQDQQFDTVNTMYTYKF